MKPDKLHDHLLEGLPQPLPAHEFEWRLAFLACLTLLLAALLLRLFRTSRLHPDHAARTDMTRLVGVVWGGLIVEWLRSRVDFASPGFWIASVALLPFVVCAVVLSTRLFRAYRQPAERRQEAPAVVLPPTAPAAPKGGKR